MMRNQLILTDQTLRVLIVAMPYTEVTEQLARALDPRKGGCLSTTQVRGLPLGLGDAASDPGCLVTREAMNRARQQLANALGRLDLDGMELAGRHGVGVYLWDEERDRDVSTMSGAASV